MAPKKKFAGPTADLPEEVAEVLRDALDASHKSKETFVEDIHEAFKQLPKENIDAACAMLRDQGNEAVKSERYDEACGHYTSVLAAYPKDHEALANRALCFLHLDDPQRALLDAAQCVNLKPKWAKGYYRLGCALEAAKAYKECASVFAKVVELEPDNAEASGRLLKARNILQMVMDTERVNDPHWMMKPPPAKTALEERVIEAQDANVAAVTAMREELGKCAFDFSLLRAALSTADKWHADSVMAKGLNAHLTANSAVLAPRRQLTALLDAPRTDAYCDAVRALVPRLVPSGTSGVVLHMGTAMGLLPLVSLSAGANLVYAVEPHAFVAKLARAQAQRHALVEFENTHWERLPLSLGLAKKLRDAGGAAFRASEYERAISLYTEALQAAETLAADDGPLRAGLLCNRALCYLKLNEADAALVDARAATVQHADGPKGHYRLAQALRDLGRIGEARSALADALRHSRGGKNDDAARMLKELEPLADRTPPTAATPPGGGGAAVAAARRRLVREDRPARMTAAQVSSAVEGRLEKVHVVHAPFEQLRPHHELTAKADLVVCHNIDFSLLGDGLVTSLNALRANDAVHARTTVLPAAARVWAMAVELKADTGVPIEMGSAFERLYWSPALRRVDLDGPWGRRVVRPLTAPISAFAFDLRVGAPPVKPEVATLALPPAAAGRLHAIVFWFELQMGPAGTLTTAPSRAAAAGATRLALGQALQFLPPTDVAEGAVLNLEARHNRTRIHFSLLGGGGVGEAGGAAAAVVPAPRRGLVLHWDLEACVDGHLNRTMAAAVRKAIFKLKKSTPALVLHVGCATGVLSIAAAQARPEVADHVVACEKSSALIEVATAAAKANSASDRISFLQKDVRNLKAHDDMPKKADVLLLSCIDHTLIGDGLLHYLAHVRGSFTTPRAALIPAAGIVKGMLVEMRTGDVHGVDLTMCDAYRWAKEVAPIDLRDESYTQLSDVFDIFVFDFATAAVEQQVEQLDVAIAKDGVASAIVIWFDLVLDEEIVVSSSPFVPREAALAVGQGIVYLQPNEAKVSRGATLPIVAAHNGVEMAFTIEEDRMTRKSDVELLPHARYDQRWEGARVNLEQQWKEILQSIARSPKEATAVAEATMRYAAQPAAFGIEGGVAERAALCFLAD